MLCLPCLLYLLIVHALFPDGRWEEATDLLDKMRGEGVYGEDMDLDYSLLDDAMMMMVTGEAQGQEEEVRKHVCLPPPVGFFGL